ncbi:hypothetical protein TSUD_72210, partial [Trifolium subterraneum]
MEISDEIILFSSYIGDVPVILAKPQTFMNLSGESVGAIVSYYKIPLKQVLVIFDDLDLPFAKLRLLPKGGHGGIGRPPGKMDPAAFVLRSFTKQEREELDFTLHRGLQAVRIILLEGFDKGATFVNSAKKIEQIGIVLQGDTSKLKVLNSFKPPFIRKNY